MRLTILIQNKFPYKLQKSLNRTTVFFVFMETRCSSFLGLCFCYKRLTVDALSLLDRLKLELDISGEKQ